jgi:CBS domain-containing protein
MGGGQARTNERRFAMSLLEFCKAPVVTASAEERVLHAARMMRDKKVGAVVITEGDKPVGILTDRDITIRVTLESKDPSTTMIRQVMTSKPHTIPEGMGLWDLIQEMKKTGVRRYPVVSGDGKLVGIITLDDLMELLGTELSGIGRTIALELGHEKLVTV